MASVRKLKKEIDYLISEVVSDCYTCLIINQQKNKDVVLDIIEKAIDVRNNLIDTANHPADNTNPKSIKKHYKALRNEILDSVDKLFSELSDSCKAA